MKGCETVWVPGSDHAGIATQVTSSITLFSPLYRVIKKNKFNGFVNNQEEYEKNNCMSIFFVKI